MARATVAALLGAVLGLSVALSVNAAVFEGSTSGSGLIYLGKFVFEYNSPGDGPSGKWAATVETASSGAVFAMFDDQDHSWKAVYEDGACSTCQCYEQHAIPPTFPLAATGSNPIGDEITEHVRPRFWYAAVITCGEEVSIDYKITFEQEDGSQVGVNDQGLYALFLVCFFVWGIGLGAQLWASRWLWRTRTFHPIVKLYTLSLVLWWLFITCLMIHWAVYNGNGVGVPFLQGLGHVFEVFARVVFLLLVMLIATGWTISSTVLRNRAHIIIAVAIVLVVYLILAIWDLVGRDPASTEYIYDAAPGILIVCLHVVLFFWFLWRLRATARDEVHTEKIKFYKWFGFLYGAWFFLLPLVVLIGTGVSPWVRTKTVVSTLMILDTIAVSILGFLLWPSRARMFFEISTDHFIGSTQQYEDL